jgi:thioester reductase-like protein
VSIFLTGGTGYLGGYVITELLQRTEARLAVMTRARSLQEAREKLWKGLQLHLDGPDFHAALARIDIVQGDLHSPGLGIDPDVRARVVRECDSVLHIAASLNRKSSRACFNTNLKGTLSVLRLAREIADGPGLRRFSYVSTVAVAGQRSHEVVLEDEAIDWNRSDYDPYGRTKKFGEHMVAELLPDISRVVFRPSIVMGDSRHGRTTQWDMVRATVALADMPIVPLDPSTRLDIIPADFVGEAISRVHLSDSPAHGIYHLAAGTGAVTAADIGRAMEPTLGRKMRFIGRLDRATDLAFRAMNRLPRGNALQPIGALMKVFWPYVIYDTVFDNQRIVAEIGRRPEPFTEYAAPLYDFAKSTRFAFPYAPYPEAP